MKNFATARFVAGAQEALGWLLFILGLGVTAAVFLRDLPWNQILAFSVSASCLGMLLIVTAQLVRAQIATAIATQSILAILKQQSASSHQETVLREPKISAPPVLR